MIRVQTEDFDIAAETAAARAEAPGAGAVVTFTGVVRGSSDGEALTAMTLEHYPGMTEAQLAAIEGQARARWPLQAVRVVHRVGRLAPGANIVLVVTAAAHRAEAFAAAEFLVDWLKTRAPFWKREETATGAHWVEARAADDSAAARWEAPPGRKAG